MVTMENVSDRIKIAIKELNGLINKLAVVAYKEDTSVSLVKKYNKFIQNRDALRSLVINETNYEFINKQIVVIEKEIKKTKKELGKNENI